MRARLPRFTAAAAASPLAGAADAQPVTRPARPARGGCGGTRRATVTPILDLPLGGWGEPGFNWRLFWGTPDAMLWKITDNVKYEEDCEVSWGAGAQPGPPSPGRVAGAAGPRWGEGAGRAAAPRGDEGVQFRSPPSFPSEFSRAPPRMGAFPKYPALAGSRGQGREWPIPPTRLTGRFLAKRNGSLPVFLEKASSGVQP